MNRYEALVANLSKPSARNEAAERIIAKHDKPGSAFRALLAEGLLPSEFAQNEGRLFSEIVETACERCDGKGRTGGYSGDPQEWDDDAWECVECSNQGVRILRERRLTLPPTTAACRILAERSESLLEAERLLDDAKKRLARFGFAGDRGVVWKTSGPLVPSKWALGEEFRLFDFLLRDLESWKWEVARAFSRREFEVKSGAFFRQAERHAELDYAWSLRADRGERLPATVPGVWDESLEIPASLVGVPFAEVENPFEPLVEIWELGIAPLAMAPGPVILRAPATSEPLSKARGTS